MRWFGVAMMIAMIPGAGSSMAVDMIMPRLEGEPWTVAGNPDLGDYTTSEQQPVDFGVWQAADGSWQLWSCIRYTDCGRETRLFHRWEGRNLTDRDWTPMGIAMEADPRRGETPGGLQAPHVVRFQGGYLMAYGDWRNICFATSEDGKTFTRRAGPGGASGVFREGRGWTNARDANLLFTRGRWFCYYTAYPDLKGYVFCRTSPDTRTWSDSCAVAYGGQAGTGAGSAECPFVLEVEPGWFILFRTQHYGREARTSVYQSSNPLNFGIDSDRGHYLGTLPVAAPEIIKHEGRYYIASLRPGLDGIQIQRLRWDRIKPRGLGRKHLDLDHTPSLEQWTVKAGDMPQIVVASASLPFDAPMGHVVSTGLEPDGSLRAEWTGVVESPIWRLFEPAYELFVAFGSDSPKLRVAVVDVATDKELFSIRGSSGPRTMQRVTFPADAVAGRKVVLRLIDESMDTGGWVHFGGAYGAPWGP